MTSLRQIAPLLASFCLYAPMPGFAAVNGDAPDFDIADARRGLLLEAGMQTGGSSHLMAMDIQPHMPNPGRESSLGGSVALSWREAYWRWGASAAYDAFHTTADQVVYSYTAGTISQQFIEKGADVSLLSRISALAETEVSLPFYKTFSVTIGAGLGRCWIDPGAYWSSAMENNDPPGWIGNMQFGLEGTPDRGNIQLRFGWEKFSYRMAGRDGIQKDYDDERYAFSVRMGFSILFPPKNRLAIRDHRRQDPTDTTGQKPSNPSDTAVGSRTPESILKVIRQNIGGFRYAYERHLRDKPDLGGKISLKFTIAPSGDIIHAKIVSSNVGDESLEQEILDLARRMSFEPIEKGNVTVTYSFVLDKQ